MKAVLWGLFWIYSATILVLAARNFWRNLMAITQAPFKVRWLVFNYRYWALDRSIRRFLKASKVQGTVAEATPKARLKPPQDQ